MYKTEGFSVHQPNPEYPHAELCSIHTPNSPAQILFCLSASGNERAAGRSFSFGSYLAAKFIAAIYPTSLQQLIYFGVKWNRESNNVIPSQAVNKQFGSVLVFRYFGRIFA